MFFDWFRKKEKAVAAPEAKTNETSKVAKVAKAQKASMVKNVAKSENVKAAVKIKIAAKTEKRVSKKKKDCIDLENIKKYPFVTGKEIAIILRISRATINSIAFREKMGLSSLQRGLISRELAMPTTDFLRWMEERGVIV